jgi:molybdenum cofactor cytidylyltransferase
MTPNAPHNGRIVCAVLAAGASSRFGGLKQLAEFPVKAGSGVPLVQIALSAAEDSKANSVLVVLGSQAAEIAASLKIARGVVVLNKDYETGLSSSIRAAVLESPPDADGLILMVADQPFVTSADIDRMIKAFVETNGKKIVALSHNDKPRNPVIFPRRFFPELSSLSGENGGREVVRRHSSEAILLNAPDGSTFLDIDTKSDLLEAATTVQRERNFAGTQRP